MKLPFSTKTPVAPLAYDERTGSVCDAACRHDAARQAAFEQAVLYGQRS